MNVCLEKIEEGTILHCLYCQKQWIGIWEYDSSRFWGTRQPDVFRDFEAATPLEGIYSHKTVVCQGCLNRVPHLYILQDKEPMLQKAEDMKQDMEDYHMLDKYVRQYFSSLSMERICEMASRSSPPGDLVQKAGVLKQRLISAVLNSFKDSHFLQDWTEKTRLKLVSLEEEKVRLLQFSLYERLPETAEDGTDFYRSCQNVPQEAYNSVKEKFDALRFLYEKSASRDAWEMEANQHRPVSQKLAARLAKQYLADMDAFLQSKGLTTDMLFGRADA